MPRIGSERTAPVLRADTVADVAPRGAPIVDAPRPVGSAASAAATGQSFIRLQGASADVMLPFAGPDPFARYVSQLERAGIFDAAQVAELKRACVVAAGNNQAAPSTTWSYSQAENAREPAVRLLQMALSAVGYDPGPADGVFGATTADAVRAFQRDRGLSVDGVIGPQTKRAMKEAGAPAWLLTRPPVIAIPLSDPHKLIPGRDQETQRLIELVKAMGCEPVLLPPCADVALPRDPNVRRNAIAAMTQNLHGVLGPGGADVDPEIYHTARSPLTGATNFARDRFEADFAQAARLQPLFMFGICRSHQLWNAAFGGKLVQDVRAEGRSAITQNQKELGIPWDQPFIVRWPDGTLRFENRFDIVQQSLLGAQVLLGSMLTNSYHHQQVDVPGDGMHVVGTVRDDELAVDNIEITEDWNVMSTQFHPEAMQHDPAQKVLLGMLGRRAQIFWLLRSLQNEGGAVNTEALLARMNQFPAGTFTDADAAWVQTEVSQRLPSR